MVKVPSNLPRILKLKLLYQESGRTSFTPKRFMDDLSSHHSLRDAAIVKLILFAGLRVGEISQLRMSDLILEERKGSVIFREGKGTKRREIPLNMKVRKALLDYLAVRPDISSDDLFLGQRNEGVQSKTIQRAVQRFAKKAEMKSVTPHTLSHSFAKA